MVEIHQVSFEIAELSIALLHYATQPHPQLLLPQSFEEQNNRLFFVLSLQEFGIIANLCTSTSLFKTWFGVCDNKL